MEELERLTLRHLRMMSSVTDDYLEGKKGLKELISQLETLYELVSGRNHLDNLEVSDFEKNFLERWSTLEVIFSIATSDEREINSDETQEVLKHVVALKKLIDKDLKRRRDALGQKR